MLLSASKSAGWDAGPDRDRIESVGSDADGDARFGRGYRRVAAAPVLFATEGNYVVTPASAARAPAAPAPMCPPVTPSTGTPGKSRAAVTLARRAAAADAPAAAELQRLGALSDAAKGLQRRRPAAAHRGFSTEPLGTRPARPEGRGSTGYQPPRRAARAEPARAPARRQPPRERRSKARSGGACI